MLYDNAIQRGRDGCVLEFGDVSIVSGHESRRRRDREIYFDLIVSIPKVHHIIWLALAIIMNISGQLISIYVKHARFHGVSRCHSDEGASRRSRERISIASIYVHGGHTYIHTNRLHHSKRDKTEISFEFQWIMWVQVSLVFIQATFVRYIYKRRCDCARIRANTHTRGMHERPCNDERTRALSRVYMSV